MVEGNGKKPLSPDERRQEELRRAYDEKQRLTIERAALIIAKHGDEIARLVDDPNRDDEIKELAVDIIAKRLAESTLHRENFSADHVIRDLDMRKVSDAVSSAHETLKANQKKEAQEHALKQVAQPQQPAQGSATPAGEAETNTPDRRNRQIGLYDELKRLSEQSPKELSPAPIVAAWRATADEVCDPKTPPPPSPRRATEPSAPPSPDQPPTPPSPNAAALSLSPDDVLQRFGNPALEASYQQQAQQQQEREAKSPFSTPATAASVVARANAPAETPREDGLMSVFVKAETKQKAEEEQAARANDPNKTLERSGRGR